MGLGTSYLHDRENNDTPIADELKADKIGKETISDGGSKSDDKSTNAKEDEHI